MKKKILTVAMAFVMLASAFAGSLKFETLGRLTNLVEASAAENVGIKTQYNRTLIFADDLAFNAEFERLGTELMPKYADLSQRLDSADNVLEWLKLSDECTYSLEKLSTYALSGVYIDGSNYTAIDEYNSVSMLGDYLSQIFDAGSQKLTENSEYFLKSLVTDSRFAPWQKLISDIINNNANALNEKQHYMLMPTLDARDSYERIYSTLIDTDLVYETVTAPDGSEVKADYTNRTDALFDTTSREYRREISEAFSKSLKNYENTFAGLLNSFVGSSESIAQRLGYSSVLDMTCEQDGITEAELMNFIKSAKDNTGISERYYSLKKQALGYDVLYSSDKYIPICKEPEQSFKFEDARQILTKALAPLGDEYISLLNEAFDNGWIDVYPADNKTSGGGTIIGAGTTPCVVINYTDNYESLSTLAHELGHAINSVMTNRSQTSAYNSQISAFSCEIASITNELLLVRYMENNAKTDEERLYYLMNEYDIISSNFFGSAMDSEFEYEIRNTVNGGGVLTADKIDAIYNKVSGEFSKGLVSTKDNEVFWICVPQFYYQFYSKAYGFSAAAACNLTENIINGSTNAVDNYLTYLKAGGSRNASELYALVGTNINEPSFINPLVERCNKIINESEVIINQRK